MNDDDEVIGKSAFDDDNIDNSHEEVVPFVSLANNTSVDEESLSQVQKRRLSDVAAESLNE